MLVFKIMSKNQGMCISVYFCSWMTLYHRRRLKWLESWQDIVPPIIRLHLVVKYKLTFFVGGPVPFITICLFFVPMYLSVVRIYISVLCNIICFIVDDIPRIT